MRLAIFIAFAAPIFACQAVDSPRLLAKDLAAVNPAFAALDPALDIGASPYAGVERVFRPDEMVRLARQSGITLSGPVSAVCFTRATEPLTAEKLLPVLRQALAIGNAQIEILDFSRFGVPRGDFDFPKSNLTPGGLWRGRVLYDNGRSMPVWVKAHITVERTWVEASEMLPMGKAIEPSQLTLKSGPRFPFDPAVVASIDSIAGRRPVRTLAAGTAINPAMLMIAHDVERGDRVAVEVRVGAAILDFQATAEASGRAGDSIPVKNPENGRSFQATIQDKGRVVVQP